MQGARAAARVALQRVGEAAQGRPGGYQVLRALQAAGYTYFSGGLAGAAATPLPPGSVASQVGGSCCLDDWPDSCVEYYEACAASAVLLGI